MKGLLSRFELITRLSSRFGSRIQNAENVVLAHDDVLRAYHLDLVARVLPKQDTVARFDVERHQFAVLEALPMANGRGAALCGFSFAESGMMIPFRVVSCSSIRFTTMRSYNE